MRSRYADTPRAACFLYGNGYEEMPETVLKLRRGAMNVWRKVQQLHEAMRHVFDNDTSDCRESL